MDKNDLGIAQALAKFIKAQANTVEYDINDFDMSDDGARYGVRHHLDNIIRAATQARDMIPEA